MGIVKNLNPLFHLTLHHTNNILRILNSTSWRNLVTVLKLTFFVLQICFSKFCRITSDIESDVNVKVTEEERNSCGQTRWLEKLKYIKVKQRFSAFFVFLLVLVRYPKTWHTHTEFLFLFGLLWVHYYNSVTH